MKSMLKIASALFLMLIMLNCTTKKEKMKYPETKKVDTVDVYFGVNVADPYRWLEDDKSDETGKWVEAQNQVTNAYLDKIPFRSKIKERLQKLWDYPKYGTPFKRGNSYYFYKNDGMQNQAVLYRLESLDGEPKVFLDPNKLSEDGTIALGGMSFSKDCKYLAYSTNASGSDWQEIHIREVDSDKKMDEVLKWVKFSGIAWYQNGFFYSRYDEPKGSELSQKNEYHKVYYHAVGTPQSSDKLVFQNPKYPLRNYGVYTSEDERYAFLSETESTSGNSLYIKETASNEDFKLIAEGFEFDYNIIGNVGDTIFMLTNYQAPNNQLVRIEFPNVQKEHWTTLIPEKDMVLESAQLIGGKLLVTYMQHASNKTFVYNYNGVIENEIQFPTLGSVGGFSGKNSDNLAFYSFTSFTYPTTIFKYDVASNKSEVYKEPEIDFNPEDYETKQVFYTSKDGTKVPMFIVHKKGLELNGNNPTLLYGYGGFNISMTPSFSIANLILLENNGVYAMANIRGGGEYGKKWHDDGTQLKKQNVFDDFIAAGEYLIENKYTSKEKLAIRGGSNGGLLVGACMTQRPDLFKVAIPAVGVLDMLRYHKFTIGWAWATDYGTSDDSVHFHNLIKYSPLHNIKEGVAYPATLVTTADHDDRVVPAHSFKFISELQAKHSGENPVLIRIDTKAGHGAGKPTTKIIEEYTDIWAFMFYNMGITPNY